MKRSFKTIAFTLMLGTGLFCGCKKDKDEVSTPTPNPTPGATFSFEKVNNRWNYNITLKDYPAVGTDSTIVDGEIITVTTDEGSGNFKALYTVDVPVFGPPQTDTIYYYVDNSTYAEKFSLAEQNTVILRSPLIIGETYKSGNSPSDSTYAQILSVSETVTVPAGTFSNLIKVKVYYAKVDENSDYEFRYFSKSFGMIKGISYYNNSEYLNMTLRTKNF